MAGHALFICVAWKLQSHISKRMYVSPLQSLSCVHYAALIIVQCLCTAYGCPSDGDDDDVLCVQNDRPGLLQYPMMLFPSSWAGLAQFHTHMLIMIAR